MSGPMSRIAVAAVIITKNEEANIRETLRSVQRFEEIVIVDSGSTDKTCEIAEEMGARVVQFAWDGRYPKKKQWSLLHSGVASRWTLLLDADELPSPELVSEIEERATSGRLDECAAYEVTLDYVFSGRRLKHGHRVKKVSLLRSGDAHFPDVRDQDLPGITEVEGHYQPVVQGEVGQLEGRLLHNDLDPVSSWIARHNKYSDWEAHLARDRALHSTIAKHRSRQGQLWQSVPFKPLVFFLYSYIGRQGFRDGRAGLDYAAGLSFYYWQTSVKIRELDRADASSKPSA